MDILIPVLILLAILVVAGVGFRMITQRGGSDQDSTSNFPNQEPRDERPLGDTPEVHSAISPHDFPKGALYDLFNTKPDEIAERKRAAYFAKRAAGSAAGADDAEAAGDVG